jgi:hypothetical protein
MTQAPHAPAPPPGPGVVPPFPAPPTEGRGRRVGLGLGLGALALLLVCGGGLAALVGLTVVMSRALNEQAEVVIGAYIDDISNRRYNAAYDSLCAEAKQQTTRAEFAAEAAALDPIEDYDVGTLDLTAEDLAVPVDVTYADGDTGRLTAYLGQSRQTGEFQVCSLEE